MSTCSLNQHCGHIPEGEIFLKTTPTTLLNNPQKVKSKSAYTCLYELTTVQNPHINTRIFGAFATFEKLLSASSPLSLRPYAWNDSDPIGRIFKKIDLRIF
jgi:hypothetical protein